jgi:hypothetical protein
MNTYTFDKPPRPLTETAPKTVGSYGVLYHPLTCLPFVVVWNGREWQDEQGTYHFEDKAVKI